MQRGFDDKSWHRSHEQRGTSKSVLDVVCDIIGSCDLVTRVNVGSELASGFVAGYGLYRCISVV